MTSSVRFLLGAVIGVAAYGALLQVTYDLLESAYVPVPAALFDFLYPRNLAVASWFTFVNLGGAIVAALPVAVGVVLLVENLRLRLALLIGFPAGLHTLASGLNRYGLPTYASSWVVEILQLISIASAVALSVALIGRIPLTLVRADAP